MSEISNYCNELSLSTFDNLIYSNQAYYKDFSLKNNFYIKNYMLLYAYKNQSLLALVLGLNYGIFFNLNNIYIKKNLYARDGFGLLNKIYVSNVIENVINYKDYKFNGFLYKLYNQNKKENPDLILLRSIMTKNYKFLINGFLSNSPLFFKEFDWSLSKKNITASDFLLDLNKKDDSTKKDLTISSKKNNVNNQNWSISSSSNEDEFMINKRLNTQLDQNTLSTGSSSNKDESMISNQLNVKLNKNSLSTSSSSFENEFNLANIWETNLRLLEEKLHLELDKFIYSDNSSFSQINGNFDTLEKRLIYFNKRKSHIIIIKKPIIATYKILSANIFLSNHKKNKFLSLSNINILVEDGSNFFVEDDRQMSLNPLINYLQKIKKNHGSDDSLIFCFNILRLYNHINNENLSIYLNLFNYNSDTWEKNQWIVDNIILRSYGNDKLSKDITDDILKFNSYVCQHQYKEANELLNKYNSDNKINKKVNKDFLKIIFALGWNILDEAFDNVNSISDNSVSDYSNSGFDFSVFD